ncbi:MAG: LacI family DNA-binding transcriptional regulator [Pseudomonadota bacterium]|nr:LacI family DNA-binding transcriptional regulator [Pseudomonadota bacterium]
MRYTVNDVAKEAGVSVATVDRVLNHRAGVRERTRLLVTESARRLGYLPASAEAAADGAALRLDFALPAGGNPFILNLRRELEAQARPGLAVRVAAIEGFNPDTLAAALLDYRGRSDGVGVVALDHPTVREAIRALAASGVAVATLASDILYVPRVAYIGVDNRAAGRLAGHLMRRFLGADRPAEVALFAGSLSYRGHEEREMGFRHLIAEEAPNLRIVDLREMKDDAERAYVEAGQALDAHPGLVGIYNIGGGTSGIARALKERGRERAVTFIAHDITAGNRLLLLDATLDAVIDQNARVEAREAVAVLENAARGLVVAPHPLRVHAIFKENIPES